MPVAREPGEKLKEGRTVDTFYYTNARFSAIYESPLLYNPHLTSFVASTTEDKLIEAIAAFGENDPTVRVAKETLDRIKEAKLSKSVIYVNEIVLNWLRVCTWWPDLQMGWKYHYDFEIEHGLRDFYDVMEMQNNRSARKHNVVLNVRPNLRSKRHLCSNCGRICHSRIGLFSHQRRCRY